MKKFLVMLGLLTVLGGGYAAVVQLSGGAFPQPIPGVTLGADRGIMRKMALDFFEDLKFKDYRRAARYHAPELQGTVDIPFLIQRLFQVKPEALDMMEYEVIFAEIDSTNLRARLKCRLKVKDLVQGNIRETELMLYFERKDLQSPWYMKLEDSLRNPEATPGKKT